MSRQKPGTIIQKENTLRKHLYSRFGEKPVHQITDSDVQKLKAALAEPIDELVQRAPREAT